MAITFDAGQVRRFRGKGVFHHSFQIQSLGDTTAIVFGDCCHEGPNRVSNQHTHTLAELCETDLIEPVIQPIPEPAPELCAQPGCCAGRPGRGPGTRAEHDRSLPEKECCHPFVAPQAKPLIAKPADVYAGAPITGTARPVLREPMPLPDGLPDVCLVCRGDTRGRNYYCTPCFDALGLSEFVRQINAWDALHRKPAAKDIPSTVPAGASAKPADADTNTEAARGGEAAVTCSVCGRDDVTDVSEHVKWHLHIPPCQPTPAPYGQTWTEQRERGPSAVAAAPGIEPWRPTVDDWDLLADAETGWRR